MDYRFIESGSAASGLIDNVGRNAAAYKVWLPAFTPIRSRFETRSRMAGSMHHDHGRNVRRLACRYLELHIHLADRYLVWCVWLIWARHGGVVRNLRYAADEEAALILDDQRLRQELFGLVAVLGENGGAGQHEHDDTLRKRSESIHTCSFLRRGDYPGVFMPFRSISTAFSSLLKRVSFFFASVIQRQYSLRCVQLSFSKTGSRVSFFSTFRKSAGISTMLAASSFEISTSTVSPGCFPICSRIDFSTPSTC